MEFKNNSATRGNYWYDIDMEDDRITSAEAARILGMSRRRIAEIMGELGGEWWGDRLVFSRQRIEAERIKGRPKRGRKPGAK